MGPQFSLPSVPDFTRSSAHPCGDLAPFSSPLGQAARRRALSPREVAPRLSRLCILPPCSAAPPPEAGLPAPFCPWPPSPPTAAQRLSPPLPMVASIPCAAGALPAGSHPLQIRAFPGRLPVAPLVRQSGSRMLRWPTPSCLCCLAPLSPGAGAPTMGRKSLQPRRHPASGLGQQRALGGPLPRPRLPSGVLD